MDEINVDSGGVKGKVINDNKWRKDGWKCRALEGQSKEMTGAKELAGFFGS